MCFACFHDEILKWWLTFYDFCWHPWDLKCYQRLAFRFVCMRQMGVFVLFLFFHAARSNNVRPERLKIREISTSPQKKSRAPICGVIMRCVWHTVIGSSCQLSTGVTFCVVHKLIQFNCETIKGQLSCDCGNEIYCNAILKCKKVYMPISLNRKMSAAVKSH